MAIIATPTAAPRAQFRHPLISAQALCGVEAFSRLDSAARQELAARCRGDLYRAGQRILGSDDRSGDVYFVISGRVQATVFSLGGRQVTLQDLGPGEMFGELAALDGGARSAHVIAVTDTLLCALPPVAFRTALRRYPEVAEATLLRLTGMVRALSARVFEASALPVRHRLYAELLRLALSAEGRRGRDGGVAEGADGGVRIELDPAPTHAELASRIGTHREGVTRELNRLRRRGLLSGGRRRLVVHDLAQLQAMVRAVVG